MAWDRELLWEMHTEQQRMADALTDLEKRHVKTMWQLTRMSAALNDVEEAAKRATLGMDDRCNVEYTLKTLLDALRRATSFNLTEATARR